MFNHLLVPLDGSAVAESILPHLVSLAHVFDAQVTILTVLKPYNNDEMLDSVDPVCWKMKKLEAEVYLDDVAYRLGQVDTPVETVLLEGDPASHIIDFADQEDVDLVLLSSHGCSGLSRWNISSVVHKVIQRIHRSFMLVRAYDQRLPSDLKSMHYRKLLMTLDGSQRAECLFAPAQLLAQFYEAQLLVAHVVAKPEMPHRIPLTAADQELINRFIRRSKQIATDYLTNLHHCLSYDFESYLRVSEDVALTLHELVDEEAVDLLIMSAHGSSGQTKWPFGSLTTSFIEYSSVPLLVVQDLQPHEIEPTRAEAVATENTDNTRWTMLPNGIMPSTAGLKHELPMPLEHTMK